jgi:hypothetical protein
LDSLFRGTSGIGLKVVANLAARLKKAYEIIEKMIAERQPVAAKESDPP